jgi:hypothetical protein
MRTIHFVCWLALPIGAILFCGLNGAGAQGTAAPAVDVRQACTPDAMRLCSDVIPDVPKVTACMHAKRAQLSKECRSAMAGGGEHHEARHRRGHVHCGRHSRHCG